MFDEPTPCDVPPRERGRPARRKGVRSATAAFRIEPRSRADEPQRSSHRARAGETPALPAKSHQADSLLSVRTSFDEPTPRDVPSRERGRPARRKGVRSSTTAFSVKPRSRADDPYRSSRAIVRARRPRSQRSLTKPTACCRFERRSTNPPRATFLPGSAGVPPAGRVCDLRPQLSTSSRVPPMMPRSEVHARSCGRDARAPGKPAPALRSGNRVRLIEVGGALMVVAGQVVGAGKLHRVALL